MMNELFVSHPVNENSIVHSEIIRAIILTCVNVYIKLINTYKLLQNNDDAGLDDKPKFNVLIIVIFL